jgi:uncharacterized protein
MEFTMNDKKLLSPVGLSDRILSLDVLRGVAVLGILIMNIQSYAMIGAAYLNPDAYGSLTGINKWVWILSHIFGDQKFMTIFSMLFGAGIVLMTSRIESKSQKSAPVHYRRTFWLLIIGLIHAYLLWHGDILVSYGLCGLFLFLFRRKKPKNLLIIGLIFILIGSLIFLMFGLSLPSWPEASYQNTLQSWKPDPSEVEWELELYRGSWIKQNPHRIQVALVFQTFIFLTLVGWRAGGVMLVGMALYKWGVFSAQHSKKFYIVLMIICFSIGFPLVICGIIQNFKANWSLDFSMFLGSQFNYWGSLFISMGFICIVMLICQFNAWKKFIRTFSAVGRMAFTNYLLQTLICTFIFYGHGLGFFGKVQRVYQILIVLGVWVVQLIISPLWLKYFRFGPAEWLWRSLTYKRFQPMKIKTGNIT